jgi:transcription initiation factor TFIIB
MNISNQNVISQWDKNNNDDNNSNDNNHYNGKQKLSSNSQLLDSNLVCSICKSNQIITDSESGELICSRCGQVISGKAKQEGPEWRNFDPLSSSYSNSKSRVGMSTSLARHDMGLSTIIGRTDRDASGQKIDAAMRSTMDRLRVWDYRTQIHSATDRNLRNAFFKLDMLKDRLGLSDSVVEKAAYIYRKAQERGLVRGGRTISGVLAAAIYTACREMGISRTLKDIASYSNVKFKELAKSYRLLLLELDLKVPIVDPMKYIVKVANKANLGEKTKRQAAQMMYNVTSRELSTGKNPMGLAASVLYISSIKTGENATQSSLSDAAGVSEVTLRATFKDLLKGLQLN